MVQFIPVDEPVGYNSDKLEYYLSRDQLGLEI